MRTTLDKNSQIAVVCRGKSAAAPVLERLLGVPVDVLDPYDVAMGRVEEKDYKALVVESFTPGREQDALNPCAARLALEGDPLTVVSLDDPVGRRLARSMGKHVFAYSDGKNEADLTAKNVNLRWGRLEFEALTDHDIARVRLPAGRGADLYGPLAAMACALGLGMPLTEAARRLGESA